MTRAEPLRAQEMGLNWTPSVGAVLGAGLSPGIICSDFRYFFSVLAQYFARAATCAAI